MAPPRKPVAAITLDSARRRARKIVALGPCEACGEPGVDRHHRDGNPRNNALANIAVLCRRCHMEADGRLIRFRDAKGHRGKELVPPRPCTNCGQLAKPLRRGRCEACATFIYKRGHERPASIWHKQERVATDFAEARRLRQQGATYNEIAASVGRGHGTVYRWLNGQPPRQEVAV